MLRARIISTLSFLIFCLLTLAVFALVLCHKKVLKDSAGKTYSSLEKIPFNKVGLVLGTAKSLGDGSANDFFTQRVEAAAALMKAGKVRYLIVSGDNGRSGYDEPTDMRNALIKLGVDSQAIYLDYAGFRTFDSMIRAREIFGQTKFTIISQRFHNERAIYIGQQYGMDCIGFNAADVAEAQQLKTEIKERFARVKMVLDLLLGEEPRFLGEKVNIPA